MNKFRNWYLTYYTEITWFLVGLLAMSAIHDLVNGNWSSLLLDIVLIYINIIFNRK